MSDSKNPDIDRVFQRPGLTRLHRLSEFAIEALSQGNPYTRPSHLLAFLVEKYGHRVAFELVYDTPIPDMSDKAAMLELARQRVEGGYGFPYAAGMSGLSESWLRQRLDPEKHEAKKRRDREYHERNKERRKEVRRQWYLAHREEHLQRVRENRRRKENGA